MNIHEYQAKEILRAEGVPIPPGEVATSAEQAEAIAKKIGGTVVVKAQVHAGGRGKAGGVKLAKTPAEAKEMRDEDPRHEDQGPHGAEGARHRRRRHRQRGVRRHHRRPRVQEAGVHGEPGRRHRHRGSRREDAREDPQAARSTRATACSRTRRCAARLLPATTTSKKARAGREDHAAALHGVHEERLLARRDQPARRHARGRGASRSTRKMVDRRQRARSPPRHRGAARRDAPRSRARSMRATRTSRSSSSTATSAAS